MKFLYYVWVNNCKLIKLLYYVWVNNCKAKDKEVKIKILPHKVCKQINSYSFFLSRRKLLLPVPLASQTTVLGIPKISLLFLPVCLVGLLGPSIVEFGATKSLGNDTFSVLCVTSHESKSVIVTRSVD